MLLDQFGNRFRLALAEQGGGPRSTQPEGTAADDVDADRLGQAFRLVEPRLGAAQVPAGTVVGQGQDSALAARDPGFLVTVENAQAALPSSAPAPSSSASPAWPPRSSAWAGCSVDTACL